LNVQVHVGLEKNNIMAEDGMKTELLKSELRQMWRGAHSRGGGEALQSGEVRRFQFSSHYQLRTTEELVETILSDVIHSVLREMNGDGPQERRGHLTVERLEEQIEWTKNNFSKTSASTQMLLVQRNNNTLKWEHIIK